MFVLVPDVTVYHIDHVVEGLSIYLLCVVVLRGSAVSGANLLLVDDNLLLTYLFA